MEILQGLACLWMHCLVVFLSSRQNMAFWIFSYIFYVLCIYNGLENIVQDKGIYCPVLDIIERDCVLVFLFLIINHDK